MATDDRTRMSTKVGISSWLWMWMCEERWKDRARRGNKCDKHGVNMAGSLKIVKSS